MLKLFSMAAMLGAISTPVAAKPVKVPIALVTVVSVAQSKQDTHMIAVHSRHKSMDVLVSGCPVPRPHSVYYLMAVPKIGYFMTPKTVMDAALKFTNNDFAKASGRVIDAKALCVVINAKESVRV